MLHSHTHCQATQANAQANSQSERKTEGQQLSFSCIEESTTKSEGWRSNSKNKEKTNHGRW
ncbi:MAG TPA: hypothetical protein PK006_05570 [Saprospiraceae bacterium]|nr:hypothetical protein [Saprospiraceae bacterium]